MLIDNINYKQVFSWINNIWAKSLAAFIAFFFGLLVGSVNTESRIINDCKFAGVFRVDIQAFACQRRI